MSRFVLTAQLQLQAPNNVRQVVQQIQSQLSGVNVNVQVQGSAQAQRQLQQVTQQANQATTAAERMGKAFALSIRRFAAFSIATRAVGLFTSTLSDAVNTAIDFERQLIKVAQVTGKSVGQLRGLTKQISNLSTGFGVASSDLLEVSTVLAQAGLTAEDTSVALKTLAKAALAPNFDSITETAEGAIAILAQFQQGVGALEQQLGSINAVAGAFAVEASDLIDVVRRTGGVFKASGGNLNELLALFTSVRATTRESAESIGTGLRTIFTRIQRPKTIEFLKQFGVELVDLNGKFVGPYEAIKRLSEALSGLGEGDLTFISIAEELGGFRQIGKVLPLLQQFSTAQSALNVAMSAGDSLTKDAASAQAALAIRIMKVKEEFLALIRSVTETSTFQIMANTALSLASALIKIGDAIKPLLPMLAAVAGIRLAKGMAGFFGGMMSGATSGRTYNKGGKVLGFARGGLVPGVGNRDTVPAMLAPGEFVIRKSSVNKMGADTLAAMNENRYAFGGTARTFGIAALDGDTLSKSDKLPISSIREKLGINLDKSNNKNVENTIRGVLGLKGSELSVTAKSDTITLNDPGIKNAIYDNVKNQMYGLITSSATALSNDTGISMRKRPINPNKVLAKVGTDSTIGSVFEGALGLLGAPFSAGKSTAAIDFPRGLGKFSSPFKTLDNMPVDAKKTSDSKKISEMLYKKIPNFFAEIVKKSPQYKTLQGQITQGKLDKLKGKEFDLTEYRRITGNSKATTADLQGVANLSRKSGNRQLFTLRNLGGLIQKFAVGGEAQAIATRLGRGPSPNWWVGNWNGKQVLTDTGLAGVWDVATGQLLKLEPIAAKMIRERGMREQADARDALKKPVAPKTEAERIAAIKAESARTLANAEAAMAAPRRDVLPDLELKNKTKKIQESIREQAKEARAARRDYQYRQRRKGFASGGGVGTDTVPALLTPGEFVVNRASAQRIGYGNLNRMNKVGRYAKGGVVQHFAAGGGVTSRSVKSDIAGLADNQSIQQEIAATAKEIKKTGEYAKRVSGSLDKQTQVTNSLYQESSALDARISNYDKVLANLAAQQGKAAATGPAANRILKMKIDAESQRIEVDKKAMAEEQKLEGIKKKYAATVEKQTQLMDKQSALIAQAKSNKQAATQLVQQPLTGGTQTNFRGADAWQSLQAQKSAAISARENEFARARAANKDRQSQRSGGIGGMINDVGGAAIAVSMVTASLQAMLPPLDDNASAFTTVSHALLGMATTIAGVVFSLQAFGLNLNAQSAMKFLGGAGLGVAGKRGVIGVAQGLGFSRNSSVTIMKTVNAVSKLAGPAIAAAGAFFAVKTGGDFFVDSILGYAQKVKAAIEKGNIEGARGVASSQARKKDRVTTLAGAAAGAVGGAAIGSAIMPVIGTAIGAGIGGLIGGLTAYMSTDLPEYAGAVAASQAAQVDVQNKLNKATEESTKLIDEYNNGTKTGIDVVKNFSATAGAVNRSRKETETVNKLALEPRGGISGFFGIGAGARLKESEDRTKAQNKQEQKFLQASMPGLNAMSRDFALAGGSFEDFMNKLKETPETKEIFDILMRQGSVELRKNFDNIAKETERAKKAFEALNLGLRAPVATATAASSALSNFTANLEVGSDPVTQSVATLEAAFSEAGQAMDSAAVGSAINDVASTLEGFGASEKSVTKFRENAAAFAAVSANYNEIFKGVKDDFTKADFENLNAEGFKDKFASNLDEQLKNAGIGDEARKRMGDVVKNIKLDDEDMKKLRGGDLSVFQKYLNEAGNKTLEEAKKVAEETAKINQQLIGLTKQRIEAERNLVQAQQEAIDLFMEGREVQGKYGGKAVTTQERRNALLAKSNVESSRLGLSAMRTGDIGDLRKRNAEIRTLFGDIEGRRTAEGGLKLTGGVEADATQQDLQKAYKTQIETIRGLIKLEEEQLKITEEKNKLEKDSMESLIKGDVEAFFKQQSAVGATAAIASGDQRLMNQYAAEALGAAALDIKRQQEAGVQTLYGQQLAGVGGLTEVAAGAALSSRGITDMRAAQVMAGTTAEEEASKSRLRELGGMLGETGQLGTEMAEMQVQTATVNINTANLKLEEIKERGRKVAEEAEAIESSPATAVTKARGGLIYANRGIFVPRGTDTIPAMLTPGEFVVNRGAVQRGNNLQILQAMNGGAGVSNSSGGTAMMAKGGYVRYLAKGSEDAETGGGMFANMSGFLKALSNFGSELKDSINKLTQTNIKITLDSTNVNINLNDGGLLKALTGQVKKEIFGLIESKFMVVEGGRLKQTGGIVP